MKKPTEVSLKYRDEGNGVVTFGVEPVNDAEYVWQKCKVKTAQWEEIGITTCNIKTEAINPSLNNGDKYRCIIRVGGRVIHYSKTFLVSPERFSSGYNRQWDKRGYAGSGYYRKSGPSVADTDGMDGLAFERYCSEVLRKNGFVDIQVKQGSGDYGIDILAKKDSISYAIQCKCYSDKVSNKAVQEAFSGKSFYGCMVAAVLTNNYFTEAAIETAKRNSVLLWDRDYLDKVIKNPETTQSNDRSYEYKSKNEDTYNQKRNQSDETSSAMPDFFKGCSNYEQVKERYRTLMKTYHPDNAAGDEEYTKAIIAQYEVLKKKYGQ